MIVVADSGPLHYLILLEQTDLLRRFYGDVLVPEAVARELLAQRPPQPVREWMSRPPAWMRVATVTSDEMAAIAEELDVGEPAALALAERLRADLILIDEADGRAEAVRRAFRVTGTLGVLRAAADEGVIDVGDTLNRLATTNFYADENLLKRIFGGSKRCIPRYRNISHRQPSSKRMQGIVADALSKRTVPPPFILSPDMGRVLLHSHLRRAR